MDKFLTSDFALVLLLALVLIIMHELGHYMAYRLFGIEARLRPNLLAPGIDPKKPVTVSRWKGIFIAINGFIFASLTVNLPLYLLGYKHSSLILLAGAIGSVLDFLWALTMLGRQTVDLKPYSSNH